MSSASTPTNGSLTEDHSSRILAGVITILLIQLIFFALRIYSRNKAKISFGLDDGLVVASAVVIVALDSIVLALVTYGGAGQHIALLEQTDPDKIATFLKLQVPLVVLYFIAIALPKLSILNLFLRIFIQRNFRIACYLLQALLVLYPLAWMITFLAACRPFEALYAVEPIPGSHCINLDPVYRYISVPNILTDVVMILLPIPAIWPLRLSTKQKFELLVTFCAGGMGLIVSCLRIRIFFETNELVDITFATAKIGIFTVLEPAGYFIASCVPVLRTLAKRESNNRPAPQDGYHPSRGVEFWSIFRTRIGRLGSGTSLAGSGTSTLYAGEQALTELPSSDHAVDSNKSNAIKVEREIRISHEERSSF